MVNILSKYDFRFSSHTDTGSFKTVRTSNFFALRGTFLRSRASEHPGSGIYKCSTNLLVRTLVHTAGNAS